MVDKLITPNVDCINIVIPRWRNLTAGKAYKVLCENTSNEVMIHDDFGALFWVSSKFFHIIAE